MNDHELKAFGLWALAGVLLFGMLAPWVAPRVCEWLQRWLMLLCHRLGQRPRAFIIGVALVSGLVLWVAFLTGHRAWPCPAVHDEFAYLLGADTFASGRLTNPPHPFWEYFESFHILQQPTYAPKYPPGQSLMLAMGIWLGGDPAYGLLLQTGAMVGAIAWLLFGWLPARWAVLGSLIVLLRFGVAGTWAATFWGGAVAAVGGALVVGALPRILRDRRWPPAVVLAVGLSILANTRPFEGGVLGLVTCGALIVAFVRQSAMERREMLLRVVLPLSMVMLGVFALMGFYNYRVTGSALSMPYLVYHGRYEVLPAFFFQHETPIPDLLHPRMEAFSTNFAGQWEAVSEKKGNLIKLAWLREVLLAKFFFGWILFIPLLFLLLVNRMKKWQGIMLAGAFLSALVWKVEIWTDNSDGLAPFPSLYIYLLAAQLLWVPILWRDRRLRFVAVAGATTAIAMSCATYCNPHYAAPMMGGLILLLCSGWRRMTVLRVRGRPVGAALSVAIAIAVLTVSIVRVVKTRGQSAFGFDRSELIRVLKEKPGKDLVLVRYASDASLDQEWVYNEADIDAAEVVWARDFQHPSNAAFRRYFKDRFVWQLHVKNGRMESPKLIARPR